MITLDFNVPFFPQMRPKVERRGEGETAGARDEETRGSGDWETRRLGDQEMRLFPLNLQKKKM
jgi:hypothetical protein